MMPLLDFLSPQAALVGLQAGTKKHALQALAVHAARLTGFAEREIFEILLQRERLGSTGIGAGIAIPHGKLQELDRLFGLVASLDAPVDFEALDEQPVDILFLLLAPEKAGADHLRALARVARLLPDPDIADRIRDARDAEALYALLTQAGTPLAGAHPEASAPA